MNGDIAPSHPVEASAAEAMMPGDGPTCAESFTDNSNGDTNLQESVSSERLRTQLLMKHHWKSPHHQLVIESLFKPVSGVSSVEVNLNDGTVGAGDGKKSTVTVSHDASTQDSELLNALQQGGYPASIVSSSFESTAGPAPLVGDEFIGRTEEAPQNHEKFVRSCFFVQGLSCSSELPVIRKIVQPVPGVSSMQVNITTRRLYVQHDCLILKAADIATHLADQGFPAQILQDGGRTHETPLATTVGRSTLQSETVLHAQDVPKIQKALVIPGIKRVGINIADSAVFIEHDVTDVTAVEIQQQLAGTKTTQEYSFSILQDAQVQLARQRDELVQQPRSLLVESTMTIANLKQGHVPVIQKAIQQHFIPSQVRAVHPHVSSRIVKVEHNPDKVDAASITGLLEKYGLVVKLVTDGAVEKTFLPLKSGISPEQEEEEAAARAALEAWQSSTLELHVILAGFFWAISLLSDIEGWEALEYAGLLSVLFGLPTVAVKAVRTLRRFEFDANCMMVIAALGAVLLEQLDEAASVSFLFCVSEYLEAQATQRARKALADIGNLRPEYANLMTGNDDEVVIVPAEQVPVGSMIAVRTGDKIPADGVIVEGSSLVDESSLTGESIPSPKMTNETVSGGAINIGETQMLIRTTSTVEDSTVSRLIRLVEEAQANRSNTEKLVDGFARGYIPVVLVLALLMATIPWLTGGDARSWTKNALIIIVVACPSAFTISTPVTYAAGLAAAAQKGVVIKGGASLEALGNVTKVLFDKTGTLTEGNFVVMHLELVDEEYYTRHDMLELLALMEGPSSHPVSSTLVKAAKLEGVTVSDATLVENHTILKGEGITAKVSGKQVYVGNRALFERIGMFDKLSGDFKFKVEEWVSEGGTVGFLGAELDGIIGCYCVMDSVRSEARKTVYSLQSEDVEVLMLTGDGEGPAHSVAQQVGIPDNLVHSQLSPEDKMHFTNSLKVPSNKFSIISNSPKVLFCGDGVNDGPALSTADVGVSMGEGAAEAMEMSDVTLMDCNLEKLLYIITMGKDVIRIIRENILLSLLCKLVVVLLTFVGRMTLLFAIASDMTVILIVTLNGMKLLPETEEESLPPMESATYQQQDDGDEDKLNTTAETAEIV